MRLRSSNWVAVPRAFPILSDSALNDVAEPHFERQDLAYHLPGTRPRPRTRKYCLDYPAGADEIELHRMWNSLIGSDSTVPRIDSPALETSASRGPATASALSRLA